MSSLRVRLFFDDRIWQTFWCLAVDPATTEPSVTFGFRFGPKRSCWQHPNPQNAWNSVRTAGCHCQVFLPDAPSCAELQVELPEVCIQRPRLRTPVARVPGIAGH